MHANSNPAVVSEHELDEIRALIEQRSGILFDRSRERFFSARVREHATARKLAHGSGLLRLIRVSNVEYDSLLERLLTQETSFFRYPDVFEVLEKRVLPELHMRKFWENPRTLRVWSAGCATGEEPYSIAITILDALEFAEAWNAHILATDISRQALAEAERGVYPARELAALSPRQIENYFQPAGKDYAVRPKVRSLVSFVPMNLVQPVYMGRFDCIFCMNVLIYFGEQRRAELIRRFYDALEPGGYLFLGHAETVVGAPVRFNTIVHRDARVYQKPDRVSERDTSANDSEAGRTT
ncbi:MAG: protein-glutamate O-methyltransferase CheR [Terriglobales bacterium]